MTSQIREIGYSALVQTGPMYHFVESWWAERRQLNQRNFLRGVTEELNTVQTSIYDTHATIAMPVLVNKKTKHSYERKCSLYSYRIYDNRMRCSDVISQSPFPIQILYLGNVSLLKTKQYIKLLSFPCIIWMKIWNVYSIGFLYDWIKWWSVNAFQPVE